MSSSSTSITKNTVVMESDEHNNNNNNIVEFDHDENDNHGNYDVNDDDDNDSHDHIPMEEHHDLVIQQSMSIGTDDDDDDDEHNHHDYYYSSDDGSRSYRTNHPNNNNNGSFLYHSTKFWNTEQNLDHHPQQHLYNYLESTEGFLLNGNSSSSRRNENHIILNHPRSGHKKNNKNSRNSSSSISGWKCCVGTMLIFILLSIFAIVVPKKTRPTTNSSSSSDAASSSSSSSSFSNNNNNTIFTLPSIHKFKGAPQYSCPNVNNNNNVNTNTMEDEAFNNRIGNRIDVNLIQQDIPEFVNTFRDRDIRQYMDIGWNNNSNSSPINVTYNTWKEQITHWRTTKYIPSLKKTGANIFEVNCGLGLNLFMTYEIIHQSQPKDDIRDVHLYGSTTTTPTRHFSHYYNDDSIRTAMTANVVLDTILQKEANFVGGGKRGMICPTTTTTTTTSSSSSSTSTTNSNNDQSNYHLSIDLSFIPDNSFDLVYTSYVPPLREIWDTDTNRMTNEEFVQRHVELCRTKESDWKSSILYNISQQQHELLYGQYVSEMIRITKPGNVIAIEHVPIPFCDTVANINDIDGNTVSYYSGGTGIAPSFWYSNHTYERYQWNDIDRTSIEMEMDASSALWWSADQNNNNYTHYHVVMKKIKR